MVKRHCSASHYSFFLTTLCATFKSKVKVVPNQLVDCFGICVDATISNMLVLVGVLTARTNLYVFAGEFWIGM